MAITLIGGAQLGAQPVTLADLKAAKTASSRAELSRRIAGGLAYGGLHVAIDVESRSNLQAVVLAANLVAAGKASWDVDFANYKRGWISVEGPRIPLDTPDAGVALAMAASAFYAALAQHEQDLEDLTAAATMPSALPDEAAGWPANGGS